MAMAQEAEKTFACRSDRKFGGSSILVSKVIVNYRGGYKNWTFWLVEKLIIWLYLHRWSLVTKLAVFTISASKHGGQMLNEVHSCEKQYSKSWIFERMGSSQNHCRHPWTKKSFQELVFKAFKNHKRNGCVDRQQARPIEQNLCFFKLKLFIFRRWWHLWMKLTTIKQKYRTNLSFYSVSLVRFTADWENWLTIDVQAA